ncbi:metal-dependent hydrolase [Noviherbaspirillum massiliense]|uniref:metal-dependent hydrolase n=1 Tax=Noviherbaspirillum massiliense TaxID=1465823 RepID=UPI000318AD73|nr:metal-dependent hydrolase [Noviherbaspirillum massiliense]
MANKKIFQALTSTVAVLMLAACASKPPAPPAPAPAVIAPDPQNRQVLVQWLGQSATKIVTPGGKVIIIDPWLTTNPKTPEQFKRLEALGKVDLILVSHAHPDHAADAPALAKLNNAPVYGPAGMNQSMITLGILPSSLSQRFGKGGTIMPLGPGIKITATHAEHSSELVWHNPATGKDETHVGGEPVGFIIEMENGFKIYHMGDTALFGDMKLIAERYKPDLIMIPIGGYFVMDPQDAALATRDFLKPKYAIPIHYGTSPQLKGTPQEFISALGNAPIRVVPMKPGEAFRF